MVLPLIAVQQDFCPALISLEDSGRIRTATTIAPAFSSSLLQETDDDFFFFNILESINCQAEQSKAVPHYWTLQLEELKAASMRVIEVQTNSGRITLHGVHLISSHLISSSHHLDSLYSSANSTDSTSHQKQ
jgi:hypothetical protein